MPYSKSPRYVRLESDYDDLIKLENRSKFIQVKPVEVMSGWPPERYEITFTCKGIARIDGDLRPITSEYHQVSLYLSSDYPVSPPGLTWLTDIWHPNIDHTPPRGVCVNAPETYFTGKPLSEQVIRLAEMVQYKHYHALEKYPWPRDREVAAWVRDVAEKNGWIGPRKPIDPRPILRKYAIQQVVELAAGAEAAIPKIRIRLGRPTGVPAGGKLTRGISLGVPKLDY